MQHIVNTWIIFILLYWWVFNHLTWENEFNDTAACYIIAVNNCLAYLAAVLQRYLPGILPEGVLHTGPSQCNKWMTEVLSPSFFLVPRDKKKKKKNKYYRSGTSRKWTSIDELYSVTKRFYSLINKVALKSLVNCAWGVCLILQKS